MMMLAKYPGKCACGGTVGPNDTVDYDHATKTITRCCPCGLTIGNFKWTTKGISVDHSASDLRNHRARTLVLARASVVRFTAKLEAAPPEQRDRIASYLDCRKRALTEAEVEAKGQRGDKSYSIPSERDIELAEVARLARLAEMEAEAAE